MANSAPERVSHEAMTGLPIQNFKFNKNILQKMKIKKQQLKTRKAISYRFVIQEMLNETFEAGARGKPSQTETPFRTVKSKGVG